MGRKQVYLVVVCSLLIHTTVIGSDIGFYHQSGIDGNLSYLVGQTVAYLLYPLLGWLADVYFTRYKFILFSFITMIVVAVVMITIAGLFMKFSEVRSLYVLVGLTLSIGLIGLGFFKSTAIQFGMDQMLEASSDQLSNFIQWYYWSCNVGHTVALFMVMGVLECFNMCVIKLTVKYPEKIDVDLHAKYFSAVCIMAIIMAGLQLVCACVGLCLLVYYKKHFNIDRTGEHPLKLIYQVLNYAWKHKCPENRSAFTYWEEDIPPRIDLGKSKYGGPFTTEEVEDTKTFFSILLLLLSLLGFHLSGHGYSVLNQLMQKQCPSHLVGLFLSEPIYLILLTFVIGVPLYQLTRKFFPKLRQRNMFKRLGVGLFCCVAKEIMVIVIQSTMTSGECCHHLQNSSMISCYYLSLELNINNSWLSISNFTNFHCRENDIPFLVLTIPNILQGLSYLLVFMTALEFICAQAPLRLKGLLIGIWYALLATNYLLVGVPEWFTAMSKSWMIFHTIRAFCIFLSLIMYLCVSKRYRYRLRDEVVNEQFLVEEIYERELDRAEQHERAHFNEKSLLITSAQNMKTHGSTEHTDAQ